MKHRTDTERLDFLERLGNEIGEVALSVVYGNIMPEGTWAIEGDDEEPDMGPGIRGAIDAAMRVAERKGT